MDDGAVTCNTLEDHCKLLNLKFEIYILLVRAKRGEVTRSHICHGIPEEKEEEEVKEMSLFVCTVSLVYFSLPFRVSVP